MLAERFELSDTLRERASRLLGCAVADWRPVVGGYTAAARYVVTAGSGRAFVKIGATALTAEMLRREAQAYARIRGPFIPQLIGWDDDKAHPLLIIEDLSEARWPPPWDGDLLDRVLEQIDLMHRSWADLPRFSGPRASDAAGWNELARAPEPFLSLGVASSEWLRRSLPRLIEAEANCRTDGEAVCHYDLRSDNICASAGRAKFIDWAEACLGNPVLDLGCWLPSLHFEGGPAPEAILPDHPEVAAWFCGYLAARAGLPDIPDAPFVRRVQREQLSTSLPWVQRALKLDEL